MDANRRGCLAEYDFAVECLKRGYDISMPLLDSSVYDCLVDTGDRVIKVQVKSTTKVPEPRTTTIHVPIQNNKQDYSSSKVDYFAVYSSYFKGFFIFKNTGSMKAVRISLEGKYSKYFNNFDFE